MGGISSVGVFPVRIFFFLTIFEQVVGAVYSPGAGTFFLKLLFPQFNFGLMFWFVLLTLLDFPDLVVWYD